ncbi:hypothetical protein Tco_0824369 [Tanacetum coccineum]|uniref:Uncharacterized protein n=1 Tax=Tanacetum coccineum TaxID=301880 RepID=A0ABQ5AKI5_9ASTR
MKSPWLVSCVHAETVCRVGGFLFKGWKKVLKAASKHLASAEKDLGNTIMLNDAGWLCSSVARERFHDERCDCLFRQSGSVKTEVVLPLKVHVVAGVTGLSLKSFTDNWNSNYLKTNDAEIPDPEVNRYWNFK